MDVTEEPISTAGATDVVEDVLNMAVKDVDCDKNGGNEIAGTDVGKVREKFSNETVGDAIVKSVGAALNPPILADHDTDIEANSLFAIGAALPETAFNDESTGVDITATEAVVGGSRELRARSPKLFNVEFADEMKPLLNVGSGKEAVGVIELNGKLRKSSTVSGLLNVGCDKDVAVEKARLKSQGKVELIGEPRKSSIVNGLLNVGCDRNVAVEVRLNS